MYKKSLTPKLVILSAIIIIVVFGYFIFSKKSVSDFSDPSNKKVDMYKLQFTPAQAVEKADAYMISKVGQKFFDSYYVFDMNQTEKRNKERKEQLDEGVKGLSSPYFVSYSYTASDKIGGGYQEVSVSFDFNGNVIEKGSRVYDCTYSCDFNIAKQEALAIAKKAGFNIFAKDFDVYLFPFSYTNNNKWTWRANEQIFITNNNCKIRELEIDAASGKVWGPFEKACPGDV